MSYKKAQARIFTELGLSYTGVRNIPRAFHALFARLENRNRAVDDLLEDKTSLEEGRAIIHDTLKPAGPGMGELQLRMAALLEKERIIDAFDAMRTGRYDADADLIRKLACVLGTSQLKTEAVLERANQVKGADMRNRQLNLRIESLQTIIEEMEEEEDY